MKYGNLIRCVDAYPSANICREKKRGQDTVWKLPRIISKQCGSLRYFTCLIFILSCKKYKNNLPGYKRSIMCYYCVFNSVCLIFFTGVVTCPTILHTSYFLNLMQRLTYRDKYWGWQSFRIQSSGADTEEDATGKPWQPPANQPSTSPTGLKLGTTVGFPRNENEDWIVRVWRKEHQFVNKLHTLHHRMKLEREWGHWEIKALHSKRNQPGLDSKPDVSGYAEERPRKREADEGWGERQRGKGLGFESMGSYRGGGGSVAQLLSLLLQDSKRTICWFS